MTSAYPYALFLWWSLYHCIIRVEQPSPLASQLSQTIRTILHHNGNFTTSNSTCLLICISVSVLHASRTSYTPVNIISGATFTEITHRITAYSSSTPFLYKVSFHTNLNNSIPKRNLLSPSCNTHSTETPHTCTQQRTLMVIQQYINDMFILKNNHYNSRHKANKESPTRLHKRALNNLHDISVNELQVDKKLNTLLNYVKAEHSKFTISPTEINQFSPKH